MRRLFVLVAAVILVDTMFYAAIAPLLPTYAEDLDLSKTAAGILSASYAAGTLIGSVPAGLAAARLGVRPTMLAGLTMLAGSSGAFALAGDVVVLDIARFTQGLGGACAWTAGLTWLMNTAPRERRGEVIGAALGVAIVGIMLGPVVGGVATVAGPEPVFGVVAVLAVVLGLRVAVTPGVAPSGPSETGRLIAGVLAAPVLIAFWLVVLPSMVSGAINVLVPLRLDELGASGVVVGAVFLTAAGLEAGLSPRVGALSDRRGRLLLIRAGLVATAFLAVLLPLPQAVGLLGVTTVVVVLVMSLLWTPAMALLNDRAEAAGLDLAYGAALVNLSWAGGAVIGGSAAPALAERTSDGIAFGTLAALLALTAAVLLVRRVGEPLRSAAQPSR